MESENWKIETTHEAAENKSDGDSLKKFFADKNAEEKLREFLKAFHKMLKENDK